MPNNHSCLILDGFNGGDGGIQYPTGLLYHWKLDEGLASANAIDAKLTLDLKRTGAPPAATGLLEGARGVFLATQHFDASSGTSTTTAFDVQTLLFECYVKAYRIGAVKQTLGGKMNAGLNTGWRVYIDDDSKVKFQIGVNNNLIGTSLVAADAASSAVWHHVMCGQIASAGPNRLYVDGVLEATGNSATITYTTVPFGLGSLGDGTQPLGSGYVDDAAFWSVPPAWTDIATVANNRWNGGIGRRYTNDP